MPVAEPTSAMPGAAELHVPPPELNTEVVDPVQTDAVPKILPGRGLTVTTVFTEHPVPKE